MEFLLATIIILLVLFLGTIFNHSRLSYKKLELEARMFDRGYVPVKDVIELPNGDLHPITRWVKPEVVTLDRYETKIKYVLVDSCGCDHEPAFYAHVQTSGDCVPQWTKVPVEARHFTSLNAVISLMTKLGGCRVAQLSEFVPK